VVHGLVADFLPSLGAGGSMALVATLSVSAVDLHHGGRFLTGGFFGNSASLGGGMASLSSVWR
jgi:hypothetical protein